MTPRIRPLPPGQWPEEMGPALAALRPPGAHHPAPRREGRPKALNALGTLAQHPVLTHAFNTFNGHVLFTSTLTPRQRELLVLRVAARRGSDYEWAQHVVLAEDIGVTAEEIASIAAIAERPAAGDWSPFEQALLDAADELVTDAMVAADTWAVLAGSLDDQQLMDLVFTVGAYDLLAMAFRSFGIELDDDLRR